MGVAASFYIVPLYTLLQHRAPKESKGNLVATSNFVNVAGGLLAIGIFWLLVFVLERVFGVDFTEDEARRSPATYIPLYQKQLQLVPSALFLSASLLTVAMIVVLCRQLPDFFVRSLLWLRSHGRYRLKVIGMINLPSDGPVILATNCDRIETCLQVVTATDRYTRFILLESAADPRPRRLLRYLARRTGLVALRPGSVTRQDWDKALTKAKRTLDSGNLLGLTVDTDRPGEEVHRFLAELRAFKPATIVPVFCGALGLPPVNGQAPEVRKVHVVIGHPLRSDTPVDELRQTIRALGFWAQETERAGNVPLTAMIPEA
jgi:hypothetical protein